ncbi:MAG: hypothetical protein R3B95_20650 [Nitrospirales bacterium]|nr:hypothetical protein [Nitrospirales bacterium]
MARPKKREQRNPILARKLDYYAWVHNEKPFPDDKKLLHDIIAALLRRLSHKDIHVARRAYHAIQLLSVAEESWERRPSTVSREMNDFERGAFYEELLCEIAETKRSRKEHWGPAFPMQREILEESLRNEGFPQRGAIEPRVSWLAHNGLDLDKLLKSIPCYCGYVAAVSLDQFSEKDITRSESIGSFVSTVLAKLHGITKKSAIKLSKSAESDGIPLWHPGLKSNLLPHEIDSRINPPFPLFDFPQPKPNF